MEEYERVLLVKPEVFVYRIPPLQSNRGYRAADWGLEKPDWKGRLRVVVKGPSCFIRLEDNSGELFAQCAVVKYPGTDVEQVKDSSRYFVIRIQDEQANRSAFIGIGFADRGDSFDLNVALQDHFKWIHKSQETSSSTNDNIPKLNLAFKEGETITIKNMNFSKKHDDKQKQTRPSASGIGLLPPPPGGNVPLLTPPPHADSVVEAAATNSNSTTTTQIATLMGDREYDGFGDFASARDTNSSSQNPKPTNWIQF